MDTVTTDRADAVFGALADATRRDILARAMDGDEGVSELAEHYPMSFAAVQKHVAVLEGAGLVTKRPDGRRRLVSTDMDGIRQAARLLDEYEQLWRGRIERMRDLLDAEADVTADSDTTADSDSTAESEVDHRPDHPSDPDRSTT